MGESGISGDDESLTSEGDVKLKHVLVLLFMCHLSEFWSTMEVVMCVVYVFAICLQTLKRFSFPSTTENRERQAPHVVNKRPTRIRRCTMMRAPIGMTISGHAGIPGIQSSLGQAPYEDRTGTLSQMMHPRWYVSVSSVLRIPPPMQCKMSYRVVCD